MSAKAEKIGILMRKSGCTHILRWKESKYILREREVEISCIQQVKFVSRFKSSKSMEHACSPEMYVKIHVWQGVAKRCKALQGLARRGR